jgi:uncharacterized membrane protein
MNFNIKDLIITIIVYLIVDTPWLVYGAKALNVDYNTHVVRIQGSPLKIKMGAGLITYVMIALCIYYFGIRNNINSSLKDKLIDALMLALAIYGSFDLINYALFDKLPLHIALADMLWGLISVTLTILITTHILNK